MKIKFIKRIEIINKLLDKINEGLELSEEEKTLLVEISK